MLYLAPTYAIRETVANTIRYRSPYETEKSVSVVAEDSPYNRYRFVIEDYANDRIVGVNLFALSPHMRTGGTHFITAVIYLVWDGQQNTWVFDDIAVGSSLWSSTAGIDRYSQVLYEPLYDEATLFPGMLLQRFLPAYGAIGR